MSRGYTLDVPACIHEVPVLLCLFVHLHMRGSLHVPYRINGFMFYPAVVKDLLAATRPFHYYNAQESVGQGFDHGNHAYVNQRVSVPKEGVFIHSFGMMS